MTPAEILFNTTVKDTGALLSSFPYRHLSHAAPGEIPSSSPHLKLQEPCPLLNPVTLAELLQLLSVMMMREFHQVLPIYK